jgi:hypothetical protein
MRNPLCRTFLFCYFIIFIYFAVLGFELRAYTLSHFTSPFFCDGFFWDRVSRTICLIVRIAILISASWVARITGVSHRRPAIIQFLRHISLSFFFGSTRVLIQSFTLARQALYHLSHPIALYRTFLRICETQGFWEDAPTKRPTLSGQQAPFLLAGVWFLDKAFVWLWKMGTQRPCDAHRGNSFAELSGWQLP